MKNIIVAKKLVQNSRYGMLVLEGDRVIGFKEKINGNSSGYINGGTYFLNKDIFIKEREFERKFSFEIDFLPKAVLDSQYYAYKTNGKFIDIGVPEDYIIAQTILRT